MKKILLFSFATFLILVSCSKNEQTDTIIYTEEVETELTLDSIMSDTTKILVAGLPIQFNHIDILMHPIGFCSLYDYDYYEKKVSSRGGKYIGDRISIAQWNDSNTFSGNLTNLIFEEPNTEKPQRKLTDKVLNITTIKYLRTFAKKISRHYILYNLQDKDTNRDGVLDNKDIETLYLSNLDGTDFRKITPENQNLNAIQLEPWYNRLYFITIEDSNKDGKFDRRDKYHYFYVNFTNPDYKIIEYNPLSYISINNQ